MITGTLVFSNPDSVPKNLSVYCAAHSVPLIMEWYGGFYAGDFYMVTFMGRDVKMDINGCMLPDSITETKDKENSQEDYPDFVEGNFV
jgi:hypothetical protein